MPTTAAGMAFYQKSLVSFVKPFVPFVYKQSIIFIQLGLV